MAKNSMRNQSAPFLRQAAGTRKTETEDEIVRKKNEIARKKKARKVAKASKPARKKKKK